MVGTVEARVRVPQGRKRLAPPPGWPCGHCRRQRAGPKVRRGVLSGHYNRVDVSLFMPRRWARLDDSTGSSLGV